MLARSRLVSTIVVLMLIAAACSSANVTSSMSGAAAAEAAPTTAVLEASEPTAPTTTADSDPEPRHEATIARAASGDRTSPHFSDQTELLSEQQGKLAVPGASGLDAVVVRG